MNGCVCDGGVEVGGMFCPVVPSLLCGRTSPGTPTWPLGPCALQSPTPATTRHRFLNSSPADHLPTCLLASSQQLIWTIAYLPALVRARRPACASSSSTVTPPTTSKLRTKYPLASRPHLIWTYRSSLEWETPVKLANEAGSWSGRHTVRPACQTCAGLSHKSKLSSQKNTFILPFLHLLVSFASDWAVLRLPVPCDLVEFMSAGTFLTKY